MDDGWGRAREHQSQAPTGPVGRRVVFGLVDENMMPTAYQWHRGFAGANQTVYALPQPEYRELVDRREAFYAKNEDGNYVGLCHFHFDRARRAWELGGLMVAGSVRGRGIGSVLGRIVTAHVVYEKKPFLNGEKILLRVVDSNGDPRKIIEEKKVFHREEGALNVPHSELPGMKTNEEGRITGDHYTLDKLGLFALAEWASSWDGVLKDGTPAEIKMLPGVSIEAWKRAFVSMQDEG